MARLASSLFFPVFPRLPSQGCSTLFTPCSLGIVPSYEFLLIVFSVPYLVSGARHFQRYVELPEYLLVDPIFGLLGCG